MNDIFKYEIKGGTCTITGYRPDDVAECIIPDMIDDAPVTGIAKYAFSEHRELVSVSLPKELAAIGAHAFYNCRSLRMIKLYDGITDMGIQKLFDGI